MCLALSRISREHCTAVLSGSPFATIFMLRLILLIVELLGGNDAEGLGSKSVAPEHAKVERGLG